LANPRNDVSDHLEAEPFAEDEDPRGSAPSPIARPRPLGLASTAFGIPAAPAPAGLAPLPDDDPVESLFRSDQTLRAPSIPAAPSEAEVTRWRTTARTSMFDEQVSDPMPGEHDPLRGGAPSRPPAPEPAAAPPGRSLELAVDPRIAARARARAEALAGAAAEPPIPFASDAGERAEVPSSAAELQPPQPGAGPRRRTKSTGKSGVRSRAEAEPPSSPADPPPSLHGEPLDSLTAGAEVPARKRRLQRGPGPLVLGLLGVAALLTVGGAAIWIGLVPNPLASPRTRVEPMPPPAPASKPRPVAQKAAPAAAPKPVAQKQPAAAQAAPQQVAAKPAAAAPAPPAAPQPAPAAAAGGAQDALVFEQDEAEAESEQRKAGPPRAASSASSPNLLAAARGFLADDEPERAEALMREALAGDPRDHHAMELLVRALMDQDRGREAVPYARMMVQRRSKRIPYRLLLGDVLLMVGDVNNARAQWRQALDLKPNDPEIKRRLGM
jgi:hypothetical protein